MTDREDTQQDDDAPVSAGVIALAQRFLISTLETSGNERLKRLAVVIKRGPEIIGEKAGPLVGKVAEVIESVISGKPVTTEEKQAIGEALQ